MTVANINPIEIAVAADVSVTDYTFGFPVLEPSSVKVTHRSSEGVDTALVFGVDYTVALTEGDTPGGTVTLVTPYASGSIIVYRRTEREQDTALPNQGPYFSRTVEKMSDRSIMIVQELGANVDNLAAAYALPKGEASAGSILLSNDTGTKYEDYMVGSASARAGKLLGFDAGGNPVTVDYSSTGDALDTTGYEVTTVDLEADKFPTDGDVEAYDSAVEPEFQSTTGGSQFDTYADDIQKFNALKKAVFEYSAKASSNTGRHVLRVAAGLHRIWGNEHMTGLNAGVHMIGQGIVQGRFASASFAASPRGDEWSRATIQIEQTPSSLYINALPESVVVGMAYTSSEIISDDTDHTASSETAIVTDDLARLNTCHIIVEIAPDRTWFKVDVPHEEGDTTQLVGGDIRLIGAGKTGFAAGLFKVALTQLALTGGFDGRSDESWLRPQYGSLIQYQDITFVDHTDPTITRDNGYAPDRKNLFIANLADIILHANCGFAGAEGHVLRVAKLVRVTANLAHFGGAGLNTRAGRSAYAQLTCSLDFTRCSFGGSADYSLLAAGLVTVSAQNCVAIGGTFGVQAITGSHINYQNSFVFGSSAGMFVATNSSITVDSNTVIENCGYSWQIRDTGKIVKLAEPKIINCGDPVDNSSTPSTFKDVVTIDSTTPTLRFKQGSTDAYISTLLGAIDLQTDSTVRDVTFGTETTGVHFTMDMGTKQILIDGVPVLSPQGAAIADADGTLADVNDKLNLVLARMRAATPSIAT